MLALSGVLLPITVVRYAPASAAKGNLTTGLGKQSATKDQYMHAKVDVRVSRGSCLHMRYKAS